MSTWLKKFYEHFEKFHKTIVTIDRKDCLYCSVKASFNDFDFQNNFFLPAMLVLAKQVKDEFESCYSGLSIEEEEDTVSFRVWR